MFGRSSKPRILLIADVPNWIFARHCSYLKKYLSDDFKFEIKMHNESYDESRYDLIYPLEFNLVKKEQIKNPSKYVTGIRSHRIWQERGLVESAAYLSTHFQRVHTLSKRLHKLLSLFVNNLQLVPNGIDTSIFKPQDPARQSRKGKLILGFAGNRRTKEKGYEEFIEPLANIKGVELRFCGYDSKNLSLKKMQGFYDSIDAYVCASSAEGQNNSLMEAAAMGKAIITTDVGNAPEYLSDNVSALIVERELPGFIKACVQLRDDPDLRSSLGGAASKSVIEKYEWEIVAQKYRNFFSQALNNQASWEPKTTEILKEIKTTN